MRALADHVGWGADPTYPSAVGGSAGYYQRGAACRGRAESCRVNAGLGPKPYIATIPLIYAAQRLVVGCLCRVCMVFTKPCAYMRACVRAHTHMRTIGKPYIPYIPLHTRGLPGTADAGEAEGVGA